MAALVRLELRRDRYVRERFESDVDPADGEGLRRILREAIKRDRHDPDRHAARYTLDVRPARGRRFTVVL